MSRELPTEPEIFLGPAERDAALAVWEEHYSIPDELRELLQKIVRGHQGESLLAQLEIDAEELARLEREFERAFSQTVYLVAADIIQSAYREQREG